MGRTIKRRKYFIEKDAQGRFILRFVLLSVLGVLVAIVSFNILSNRRLDTVLFAMKLPEVSPGGILLKEMVYAFLISAVFIVVAFFITATRLFRKINGPLLKLASDVRRIAEGDLQTTIQLRRNDEFQGLAGDLNHMAVKLNGRLGPIKRAVSELSILAKAVHDAPDPIRQQQLKEKLSELEEKLRAFKV